MKQTQDATHRYWENLVKRTWEALRRNGEFRSDCMHVGDSCLSDGEIAMRFKRFTEKWGVECNDPDLSYEQIKAQVDSWQLQLDGQSKENVRAAQPDIPVCFVFLLSRLQGYSGPRDLVVQCQEWEEMMEVLDAKTEGQLQDKPVERWWDVLGNWAPPNKIHFTVDIEADPFTIAHRVLNDVALLRYVRARGRYSAPIPQRTFQKLQGVDGYHSDPQQRARLDFAQDVAVWSVWDLKKQGKTDMEIAQKVWPTEYKRGKSRVTQTGDKGPLAQRVHDYHKRAKEWIKKYPKLVRHSMKVL